MRKISWSILIAAFASFLATGIAPAQSVDGAEPTGGVLHAAGDSVADIWHKVVPVSHTPAAPNPQDATSLSSRGKASPELFLQMAMFAEQSGRVDQAEENYTKALKLSPKHIGALLGYAGFKDRQRAPREAMELYQKAVKYHPKEAAVYNDFGLFYARQRKYAEAIAQYEKAIQLQPARPRYRNNIAIVLVETGDYDKALTHLASTSRESDACYNMGYLLSKKGEMAASRPYFAKAVELDPTRTDAQTWLEHIDQALAASEAAKPDARSAVASQGPSSPGSQAAPGGAARRENSDSPPRTARRFVPRSDADPGDAVAPPRGAVRPSLPPAPEPPPSERRLPAERPAPAEKKPAAPGVRRLPPPSSEQGVEVPAAPARLPAARTESERRPGPVDAASKPSGARNAAPANSGEPGPLPPDAPIPSDLPRAKPARLPPVGDLLEPPLPPTTRSGRRIANF